MDQRVQFIADYQRAVFDIAELARRYGISRKTDIVQLDVYVGSGLRGPTSDLFAGTGLSFRLPR